MIKGNIRFSVYDTEHKEETYEMEPSHVMCTPNGITSDYIDRLLSNFCTTTWGSVDTDGLSDPSQTIRLYDPCYKLKTNWYHSTDNGGENTGGYISLNAGDPNGDNSADGGIRNWGIVIGTGDAGAGTDAISICQSDSVAETNAVYYNEIKMTGFIGAFAGIWTKTQLQIINSWASGAGAGAGDTINHTIIAEKEFTSAVTVTQYQTLKVEWYLRYGTAVDGNAGTW